MNTLYIVPTPIGNLEDITLRALRILREVDLIACEDTRMTKKLCSHYEIDTQLQSYHANSSEKQSEKILKALDDGKNVALVSDSGTPTISDPGVRLVADVKERLSEVVVMPLPGATASVTAFSASGIASGEFTFLGFLPNKKGRQKIFEEIAESNRTIILYESPHRTLKTLKSLSESLEDNRQIVIARELTKIYESFVKGSPSEVLFHFEDNPDQVRGEFVIIIEGRKKIKK